MLQVTYKKHGLKVSHVWFATEVEIENNLYRNQISDLYFIHGYKNSLVKYKGIQKSNTL